MSPHPPFTYPLDATHDPKNTSKVILVTGVNGYIASHITLLLLQKGYTVRGTSRSPTTPEKLLNQPAFKQYTTTSQLQHVVIQDITAPGVFDDATKDVHAIIHTASPVDFTLKTTDDFFTPAIGGVLSILKSAYQENQRGGNIVSFVQLSSIAAIVDRWRYPPISDGGVENRDYTEDDWNMSGEAVARTSEQNAKEGKGPFLPMVAYGASKAAGEKAMWAFVKAQTQKDGRWIGPACSAVNPGVTTGPPVNWPETPERLNETLLPVWNIWSGKSTPGDALSRQIGGATYIDVRDVAAIHVWAVEHPDLSGGGRYLMTNGKAPPQAIADVIRDSLYKHDVEVRERVQVGVPGLGYVDDCGWPGDEPTCKATRAHKALGVASFRGYADSIGDTIESFRSQWPEKRL